MKRLATWIPPIMWMAVVLAMSSAQMSAENTGSILRPLLNWLLPGLRPPHLDVIHAVVRKTAHVTEYGILAALWRRAFVRGQVVRPALAGALAWGVAVICAIVDETHQSFLPSRTGTVSDVMLDSAGALAAILLIQVSQWQGVDALTGVLLWVAVLGGISALVLDLAAGAGGGLLWVTVPAAAIWLVYRRRKATSGG